MAVSAFKSSTRRRTPVTSASSTNKEKSKDSSTSRSSNNLLHRRSRSVSAFSRSHFDVASSTEFLVKRDNPLYWASSNSGLELDETVPVPLKEAKVADNCRRGRSTSRDIGVAPKQIGRSLSRTRIDTGRRGRSVSRFPVYANTESETEHEVSFSSIGRNRSNRNVALYGDQKSKSKMVRTSSDMHDKVRGSELWSRQTDLKTPCYEDQVSTSSCSEVEEKTIKAVCEEIKPSQGDRLGGYASDSGICETVRYEVRRAISDIHNDLQSAIFRGSSPFVATTITSDVPPDLGNPSAVESVLVLRREYSKKVEESQELARKLRADLAVEEHREIELSRILKEVLPDPKTSSLQKPHAGRKASIERRKMSKRLTEEAMAYFDECVSISTFDTSDFSSPEDQPIIPVRTTLVGDHLSLSQSSSRASVNFQSSCLNDKQETSTKSQYIESRETSPSNNSKDTTMDFTILDREFVQKFQFSFSNNPAETFNLGEDIKKYVRNFEKVNLKSQDARSSQYIMEEYNSHVAPETLLTDRVFFKNRLDSGSMLLCGGGFSGRLCHFASAI